MMEQRAGTIAQPACPKSMHEHIAQNGALPLPLGKSVCSTQVRIGANCFIKLKQSAESAGLECKFLYLTG
jgi:hypothetical protein